MTLSKKLASIFSVFALIFAFSISSAAAQDNSVVEVVQSSEDHTIFAELLDETGLSDAVSNEGPFTVIAPTDEAFESMDTDLDELRQNSDQLQTIVVGHLFQGKIQAAEAEPALDVEITEGDIEASNGVVHVTNEVIQGNQ